MYMMTRTYPVFEEQEYSNSHHHNVSELAVVPFNSSQNSIMHGADRNNRGIGGCVKKQARIAGRKDSQTKT